MSWPSVQALWNRLVSRFGVAGRRHPLVDRTAAWDLLSMVRKALTAKTFWESLRSASRHSSSSLTRTLMLRLIPTCRLSTTLCKPVSTGFKSKHRPGRRMSLVSFLFTWSLICSICQIWQTCRSDWVWSCHPGQQPLLRSIQLDHSFNQCGYRDNSFIDYDIFDCNNDLLNSRPFIHGLLQLDGCH